MELKTNSKCQLIVDGLPDKKDGFATIELLIHDIDWNNYVLQINREEEYFIYNMEEDGLYSYYIFYTDNLDEIKNKENLPRYLLDSKDGDVRPEPKLQLFSICNLRNCILTLEKEAISDFISSVYTKKKCEKNSQDSLKDYLLISIFVLENLICQERYSEATMILESLKTCDGLCNQVKLKSCNCNE